MAKNTEHFIGTKDFIGADECLERLRVAGMRPPFSLTCIAANGATYTVRCTGTWKALRIEPSQLDMFHNYLLWREVQLPLYFLCVDERGEAVGLRIAPQECCFLRWPALGADPVPAIPAEGAGARTRRRKRPANAPTVSGGTTVH